MATSSPVVLHHYKTTVIMWLIPLFFVLGCMLLALGLGLPRLLNLPSDASTMISIAIPIIAGFGMPILSVLLWLLIPAIVTTYDASRRVLQMEYRRPLGRSVKEYRLDEIADFRPTAQGERTYSLTMILKSGARKRLEYSSTSNTGQIEAAATKIKATLGMNREIRL